LRGERGIAVKASVYGTDTQLKFVVCKGHVRIKAEKTKFTRRWVFQDGAWIYLVQDRAQRRALTMTWCDRRVL